MNKGEGGSRAAKKRKKRQESVAKKSSGDSTLPGDSGLTGDDNGDESSEFGGTKGDINRQKRKKDTYFMDVVHEEADQLETNLETRSILEILALDDPTAITSTKKAALLLSSLVQDHEEGSLSIFYKDFWGKKPLHTRKAKGYLKGLVSKKALFKLLDNQSLSLGQDLAVLNNSNGETHQKYPLRGSPVNAANDKSSELDSNEVLRIYKETGGHLRFLSPQTHIDMISRFLAALEIHFNSRVACHCEVVPSRSQEWGSMLVDKADSFIIQIAGTSMWRVHAPKTGEALKCNVSSFDENAATNEEEEGVIRQATVSYLESSLEEQEYLHITLQAGDTLYIPKGWGFKYRYEMPESEDLTHGKKRKSKEARSSEDGGALFMRLFTNEGTTYKDLLDQVMPAALQVCFEEVPSFRQSLPYDYASCLGAVHSEAEENPKRQALLDSAASMLQQVNRVASSLLDSGVDQLIKRFIGQRQPLLLTEEEEAISAAGFADARIMSYTRLRMLRPGIARCVVEDGVCVLYHCMDNSRELYGAPLNPLEFDLDDGICIEGLLSAYPHAIMVADLPHPSEEDEDKVGVAQALYKEGFLVIDNDVVTRGAVAAENDDSEDESEDEGGEGDDNPF